MAYREAVIEGTETRVLRSELAEKEYLISLGLLCAYRDEPEKKWPVVYLMDRLARTDPKDRCYCSMTMSPSSVQ